jgi:acyl transferase domain-containing protein/NAD(P)-dependent dehydrogenase (short-subunit alcohol dehydrogenase family)
MALRVSGASSIDAFWENLMSGRDPFVPLPNSRFDAEIFAKELPMGAPPRAFGALIDDFGLDWRSLRLPPAQIERLHRVERLSLAVMGDALSDASLWPRRGPLDKGGIWMAASSFGPDPWLDPMPRIRRFELIAPVNEALDNIIPERAREIRGVVERVSDLAAPPLEPDALMVSACIAAGRASQIYDLRGGHLAIDAGMCSSLAALAQAIHALQIGECDQALVCAAAPLVTPSAVLCYAHRGELGRERPRPFAQDASGTLLGDGAVAVVLERADDVARKRVYAVIHGVGFSTAPGKTAHEALAQCVAEAAEQALGQAEIAAREVRLIESRAAGIASADAAEATGLSQAYGSAADLPPALLTSSVPAAGFLQSASGLLALAKACLSIQRRCWPGQAATREAFEAHRGIRVAREAETWTGARLAAVSDAGPGCIAYHAILGDPRDAKQPARPARRVVAPEPIAVVGAGVIAPGAANLEAFWRNALARREELADLPKSRWNVDRLIGSSPELARAFRTRIACTIDLPELTKAAERLDPQACSTLDPATLLALGVAEHALRDAGYQPRVWPAHRVQVIFGQIALRAHEVAVEKRVQYAILAALAGEAMREAGIDERTISAILADAQLRFDGENLSVTKHSSNYFSGLAAAERTAAAFGFSGKILSVDAACASSLAAIKMAADSLRAGDADVVLAGGVSFHLLPEYYVGLGLLDALSTQGGRPFHRDADGFIPAEAAGAVVLKRLSAARAANDRIYAVIAGHGVSSDGHGLTIYSPNPAGQQLAMTRALTAAGVAPTDIDLIEAHGPGAPLGDRAEMTSIAGTYAARPFVPPLAVASAKSLIGHSSSAGAMISFIRAAMALGSKVIPPSGGTGELAADLPFGSTIELSRVTRPWVTAPGRIRRAAVNSFGMTGIDHHVILEEASPEPCRTDLPLASIDHPATRPGSPLSAGRFVPVELAVALPAREPLYPLHGKALAIVSAGGALAQEVESVFTARGARLVHLNTRDVHSEAEVLAATADFGRLDGVIDLRGFGNGSDVVSLSANALWSRVKNRSDLTFAVVRALYERFANLEAGPGCFVAVTSVGGAHGSGYDPLGAFFQGFARSLKQEIPTLRCKAIDLEPTMPMAEAAAAIARELEDGNDRVDVRYSDRRYVTTLRRRDFADPAPVLTRLLPGQVFVFSGGGRGVVYQCATALAQRGLHVVVTGRRPLPDPSLHWVKMTDSEFGEFRRAELVRLRGKEGPARIIRTLDQLDLQRQAYANIATARAAGLSIHYEVCDIVDPSSVLALTQRVRTQFGHIDGVGHGAMIEHSATLPRKSQQDIDATLATKVMGLANLIEATRQDQLRVFVAFGSGVGRYGNSGQTDYAAANALVATLLEAHAKTDLAATHCVTMDWPAWESLGATANPDIAGLLRNAGVTSISPNEGSYWFLSELSLGAAPEVVICGEPMLQAWPFLVRDADGIGERAIEVDDDGMTLLPSKWPMLDRAVKRTSDVLVVEREISVERDFYMPQHLLNGLPVLPATFGCEMLAEGALLASPGYNVRELRGFHVDAPLGLPRSMPVKANVTIRLAEQTELERVVQCEVRSPLAAKLKLAEDRLHHAATVILTRSPPGGLGTYDMPRRSGVTHATSFYASLRDPVRLGQLFSIARWIQVFDNEAIGVIEPPELAAMFAEYSTPRLVACPLVIDAALQVAGSWDGYRNGFVSVPIGIDAVVLGRKPGPSERLRAHARFLRASAAEVFYDVMVVGENSELVAKLRDVHLRRVGIPMDHE